MLCIAKGRKLTYALVREQSKRFLEITWLTPLSLPPSFPIYNHYFQNLIADLKFTTQKTVVGKKSFLQNFDLCPFAKLLQHLKWLKWQDSNDAYYSLVPNESPPPLIDIWNLWTNRWLIFYVKCLISSEVMIFSSMSFSKLLPTSKRSF